MKHRIGFVCLLALGLAFVPRHALANFHVMEVEQIIGGVGGNTTAQAITLKTRTTTQNQVVGNAQIRVWDAAGANPVTISTFTGTDPNDASACKEILLATAGMAGKTQPAVSPDFTMTNPIPQSYLAAGSLTFESTGGAVTWWRVSWGGASYTGATTVAAGTNDVDGNTAPAFAGALPSTGVQALKFQPACGALSTNSAADYAVISGTVTLKKNSGATFNVADLLPVPALPGATRFLLPAVLGLGLLAFAVRRRRPS
jgi:autotransporter-associated beta strand protein